MAGYKARIDKDSNHYLSPNSRPEAEMQTAYKSNKELEGTTQGEDEPGVKDVNFTGSTKKDRTRKADQTTTGTSGDMGSGLEKMESKNPFMSVVRNRFVSESENPGVASAPATSDSPSLGMMSVNNTDFRPPQTDVRAVLESIALQAAETFELLDQNSNVPDTFVNELQTSAKALGRIYEFVTKNQQSAGDAMDTSPVAKDTPTMPQMKEEAEVDEAVRIKLTTPGDGGKSMKAHHGKLVGNQHKIDANHNGRLDAHDFKLLRAKKTMKEATDIVFRELLRGKLDGDY
jgi:hypothetical protein